MKNYAIAINIVTVFFDAILRAFKSFASKLIKMKIYDYYEYGRWMARIENGHVIWFESFVAGWSHPANQPDKCAYNEKPKHNSKPSGFIRLYVLDVCLI